MGNNDQDKKNNGKIIQNCFPIQEFILPQGPDQIGLLSVQSEIDPALLKTKKPWDGPNVEELIKAAYGAEPKRIKHIKKADKPYIIHFNMDIASPTLFALILTSHAYYEHFFNVKFVYTNKPAEASIIYKVSPPIDETADAWVSHDSYPKKDNFKCVMHFSQNVGTHKLCCELDKAHSLSSKFANSIYKLSWNELINNQQYKTVLGHLFSKGAMATILHEGSHAFLGANHLGDYNGNQFKNDPQKFFDHLISKTNYQFATAQTGPAYLGRTLPMWSMGFLDYHMMLKQYQGSQTSFDKATYIVDNSFETPGISSANNGIHNLVTTFSGMPSFTFLAEGKRNVLKLERIQFSKPVEPHKQTGVSVALKDFGGAMAFQDGKQIAYLGFMNGSQFHELRLGEGCNRAILADVTDKVVLNGHQKETVITFAENTNPNFVLDTDQSSGLILLDGSVKNINIVDPNKEVGDLVYCSAGCIHLNLLDKAYTPPLQTTINFPSQFASTIKLNDKTLDAYKQPAPEGPFTIAAGNIIKVNHLFNVDSTVHYNSGTTLCAGNHIDAKRQWTVCFEIDEADKGKVFLTRIKQGPEYDATSNTGDLILNTDQGDHTSTHAHINCDDEFLSYYRLVATQTLSKPVTVTAKSTIQHPLKTITKTYNLKIEPSTIKTSTPVFARLGDIFDLKTVLAKDTLGFHTRENKALVFYDNNKNPIPHFTCNTRYYLEKSQFNKLWINVNALDNFSLRYPSGHIERLNRTDVQKKLGVTLSAQSSPNQLLEKR